ncbi:hypothetical protein AMECASPLE_022062 [Ameca splendens]|uniref:Uncharacterized protein n=1 Tax=Ameca splendens TaxID=208324 RepID=A0ABV0XGR5_9TELE
MAADVRAASNNLASSSATAPSPRLAAALPMPSSFASAQVYAATPGELEERLRLFPCQIKSFWRISLLHSSPELKAKVREMEEDYKAAVRHFYCRPPPSSPGPRSTAAAAQPTPGPQSAAVAQPTTGPQGSADAEQPTPGLQSSAAAELPQLPTHAAEDVGRGTPWLKSSGVPATCAEGSF